MSELFDSLMKTAGRTAAVSRLARIQAQNMVLDGILTDDDVLEISALFPEWTPWNYSIGAVRNHHNQVWQCVQAHDSGANPSWTPEATPALWSAYHAENPAQARAWIKPSGAQDAYQKGEVMRYVDEEIYRSKLDANVHSPEEYAQGWEKL